MYFRSTDVPELPKDGTIQDMWETLIGDDSRNKHIVSDILELLKKNKSPLIFSDRIEHIETLCSDLRQKTNKPIFVLKGGV